MSHNSKKGVSFMDNTQEQSVEMKIGGEFPFPCPMEDGVRMELFGDNLALMIQVPEMELADIEAFGAGVSEYSYMESCTKAPVGFWTFKFNSPLNHIECNFDAKVPHEECARRFVDEKLGHKNGLTFFLLQGKKIVSVRCAELADEAWESFYKTIKAQLDTDYTEKDYFDSLESMYNFTMEEIVAMGKTYSL